MEFYLGLASGVFPQESVSLHQLDVVLLSHANVQDALVVPPGPLGLLDDGCQGVGEIFEQQVLFLHVHPEDPIEELAHLVVALVKGEHARAVLAGGDQTHADKAVGDIWERSGVIKGR